MSAGDTQPPPADQDDVSAGLHADVATEIAAAAAAPTSSPADTPAPDDAEAGDAQETPADRLGKLLGDGDPPVAVGAQESQPWKPGPTTQLDAAAHQIIDGPDADPPRRRVRPGVPPLREPGEPTPESAPWRGPPAAPPSEQVRPSARHINADTPAHGHAPPSISSGPTAPRTVAESPGGARTRVRHNRIAGIAQAASHSHGDTPAAGDSRAMEQRMQPKGPRGALSVRMAQVRAQHAALIADPPTERRRRRPREGRPSTTPPMRTGPKGLGAHMREVLRQRLDAAKK